jgi:hypothetical protein
MAKGLIKKPHNEAQDELNRGERNTKKKDKGRQLNTSHQPQALQQTCYKTGHQQGQNNHPYKILPTPKQQTNNTQYNFI